MNEHQRHLLGLLKEIDGYCRKHGVTYRCAGGTVIGAARHGGFIPWDDDIDIYMTRGEFARFAEAFRTDPPEGRTLEYYETDHDHHSTVARYCEEGTTMFCHTHLLGYASAGIMIDIFILDPMPDDREERMEYLAGLYAYADLIVPILSHSQRLPLRYSHVCDEAFALAKAEGVPAAVEAVSRRIFRYEEEDCRDYCLRWGSVPLIYPIDVIGDPVYLPFEDMEIPVPRDWFRYLVIHYGCRWMDLPYVEHQRTHTNILHDDRPYGEYYERRDAIFDQEEVLAVHRRRTEIHRKLRQARAPLDDYAAGLRSRIGDLQMRKEMDRLGAGSLTELFDAGRYEDVVKVCRPYLGLQTMEACMGQRMRHGSQLRWFDPVIVPMADEDLRAVLYSLLRLDDMRMAEKIVGIYDRAGRKSGAIDEIRLLLDEIEGAAGACYREENEECLDRIGRIPGWADYPYLRELYWQASVRRGLTRQEGSELQELAERAGAPEGIRKAWGDLLMAEGRREEAEKVYRDLMDGCRNGLFWQDIARRGVELPPIPTERPSEFRDTEVTARERILLREIAGICREEGIRFVIGRELATRMAAFGNPGISRKNRILYMDAENAERFRIAFEKRHPEGRRLLSWAGGDRVAELCLLYADEDSVFCDLPRLPRQKGIGLAVTIRILRSDRTPKSYRESARKRERILGILERDERDLAGEGGPKRIAMALIRSRYGGAKERGYRKRLYAECVGQEIREGAGPWYYLARTIGGVPRRRDFPSEDWERTENLRIGGTDYPVPEAALDPEAMGRVEVEENLPGRSLFILDSASFSWKEIEPLLDEEAYRALDWKKYLDLRGKAARIDGEVDKIWMRMLQEDDMI